MQAACFCCEYLVRGIRSQREVKSLLRDFHMIDLYYDP